MRKSIAILAVVASPLAIAADMPTVYGKINKAYVNTDQEQNTAKTRTKGSNEGISDVANSVSRLGVKGETTTDGGKVSYNLELGLNSGTTGSGTVALRNAEATLSHNWGSLTLGQTYNPLSAKGLKADPLASTIAGHQGSDVAQRVDEASGAIGFTYRGRVDGLTYTTPEMMGLTYTISQDRNNENRNDSANTPATHTEHVVSYTRNVGGMDLSAYLGYDMWSQVGTKDNKEMVYGLGLSKDALSFNVAMSSWESKTTGATYAMETERMFASASYMMGKSTFALSYQTKEAKKETSATSAYTISQIGVGYKHQCSKAVDLNLTALKWKNELETAGSTAVQKKDSGNEATLIAAGIQVKF